MASTAFAGSCFVAAAVASTNLHTSISGFYFIWFHLTKRCHLSHPKIDKKVDFFFFRIVTLQLSIMLCNLNIIDVFVMRIDH